MIEIIKNANLNWLAYIKTKQGLIASFITLTLVMLLIRPNSLIELTAVLFGVVISFYISSLFTSSVEVFFSRKRKSLNDRLKHPQNLEWSVYNNNGIKIGKIDEADYYKEVLAVETSWSILVKQVLNILKLPFSMALSFARSLPMVILSVVILLAYLAPESGWENLTVGKSLVLIFEHKSIVINLLVVCFLLAIGTRVMLGKSVPGYINHYSLELQKRLATHLPLLAVVDGFSVVGFKVHEDGQIELPNTDNAT